MRTRPPLPGSTTNANNSARNLGIPNGGVRGRAGATGFARRNTRVSFANDRFVCPCSSGWYCEHVRKFYDECSDAGLHTVISSATEGRVSEMYLPLTDKTPILYVVKVVRHPRIEDEYMIKIGEEFEPGGIEMLLSRDDGLIAMIRATQDHYRSTTEYKRCMHQMLARKRLPCENATHARDNDIDLVREMRRVFELSTRTPLTPETDLTPHRDILDEIALDNAYSLNRWEECYSCHHRRVNPSAIPDDLIPAI